MRGNSLVLAGTGGVESGFTKLWGYIVTRGLDIIGLGRTVSPTGYINLEVKLTRKRNAGDPYVAFDEAGAGNVAMVENVNPTGNRKSPCGNPSPEVCAPVLDPTCEEH